MGYTGSVIQIPIADGGLMTDLSPDLIPPKNLIKANNVLIRQGIIQKTPGAKAFNAAALTSGVVAVYDYHPLPGKQYLIAVTRAGKVYRYTDKYDVSEVVPTTDATLIAASGIPPTALSVTERVHIVEGGKEFLGVGGTQQPAKIFIFTGNNPVQVIYGEELTRHNLRVPAIDWNGTIGHTGYPTFGIVYLSRLFVLGNSNLPSFAYASSNQVGGSPTFMYGHEDFSEVTFNTALFNIYPGDGEKLTTMFKYKTKLWALKYPRGLYSLEIPDVGDPLGWYFQKVNDDVGTPSITGATALLDDVWVVNATGTVQSLGATLNLGGVTASNELTNMQIEKFIQQNTNALGFGERQAFWHEAKSTAYFVYRGLNSNVNSFLLSIDFTQEIPKPTTHTCFQPNVLAIRKDVSQQEQIMYGSEDGFIYLMDQTDRSIDTGVPSVSLTGTTIVNGSSTVVGVGTLFLTELTVGSRINVSSSTGAVVFVQAIASNLSMTVSSPIGDGTLQTIKKVSPTAYLSEFQTPHMYVHQSTDVNFNAQSTADKHFDFVEIEYIPTGKFTLLCDVFIDGRKQETIQFLLNQTNQLDHFVLDLSRLQGRSTRRQRKAIHGRGRTVSLRFYNSVLNQNFKITGISVHARISGVDAKGSQDAGTKDNQ